MNKLIYVCSPYRAENIEDFRSNMRLARIACRAVAQAGNIPIATHVYFPEFLEDDNIWERNKALDMGKALLAKCDAIWVVTKNISKGMAGEIEEAKKLGLEFVNYES